MELTVLFFPLREKDLRFIIFGVSRLHVRFILLIRTHVHRQSFPNFSPWGRLRGALENKHQRYESNA